MGPSASWRRPKVPSYPRHSPAPPCSPAWRCRTVDRPQNERSGDLCHVSPASHSARYFPLLPRARLGRGAGPGQRLRRESPQGEGGRHGRPALLAYFRARTLSQEDLDRLATTVPKLGDNDFDTREKASRDLTAAGPPALNFLKNALTSTDPEIARRAHLCIEDIEANRSSGVTSAAARVLALRRPDGAAASLLAYLPSNDEDIVEESVFAALREVGLHDGKPDPAVTAALTDRQAIRRAAAAHVQGRAKDAADRRLTARLLTDADARVRFEAAAALVRSGDKSAVPVLMAQLTEAPEPITWKVEELLVRLAGDDAPVFGLGVTEAEHRQARAAWEKWWTVNGDKADLTKLQKDDPFLGLTLVCEYDGDAQGGRVYEMGRDGKVRWAINGLNGPNDVQPLPGGRVLIAERNANRVTERDHKGNIIWTQNDMNSPIACVRLPGGNTLIASFGEIYEVTPDNKKVHTIPGSFRHAVRLRNGHIVYITSDAQVTEMDAGWKTVRTAKPEKYQSGAGYWASVELLANGRLLIALGGSNQVVEMDWTGKVHWEFPAMKGVPNCVYASRLPNGNTLVSAFEGRSLVEVDRTGREVTTTKLNGRPFTVRRY